MKLPLEMKDNGYSSKLKYEDNLSKVTNEMDQARGGAPFLQQSAGQVYSPQKSLRQNIFQGFNSA